LIKLDMLRRRFELLKVGRLEGAGFVESWSVMDGLVSVGVKGAPVARGVC